MKYRLIGSFGLAAGLAFTELSFAQETKEQPQMPHAGEIYWMSADRTVPKEANAIAPESKNPDKAFNVYDDAVAIEKSLPVFIAKPEPAPPAQKSGQQNKNRTPSPK